MQREVSNEPGTPRIGVVLSSGGVRGVYAHTGFMQAIQSLGIPVSASAGCSAGALIGGFIASGTPLEDWAATLAEMTSRAFWTPDSVARFIWEMTAHKGRGYPGLSDTSAALQFTRDNLAVSTFEECLYPFQASAAMPILYDPVRIDDEYYCDGALIDFAPTDAICCRHQLDVVIVHHVAQHSGIHRDLDTALKDQWAMLEVVNRLVFREQPWYLSGEPLSLHHCPCGCGAIVIAIDPDLPEMRWPVTKDGDAVQSRARGQTETLLQPYLNALKSNPRQQLPVSGKTATHPANGCGTNEKH